MANSDSSFFQWHCKRDVPTFSQTSLTGSTSGSTAGSTAGGIAGSTAGSTTGSKIKKIADTLTAIHLKHWIQFSNVIFGHF